MDINAKDGAAIRLQIAEALRWTDAHGLIDVGIYLDRALIAFDADLERCGRLDGMKGNRADREDGAARSGGNTDDLGRAF